MKMTMINFSLVNSKENQNLSYIYFFIFLYSILTHSKTKGCEYDLKVGEKFISVDKHHEIM